MREIKFRVWDKELKEMCSVTDIQLWINYVHYSRKDSDIGKGNYPADVILMQYTGLKDKNGTEIYEGDIVYDPWGDKHIVIWDEESMMFTYDVNEWWMPYLWCRSHEADELDKPEVIGNIYDNPELLKTGK